MTGAPKYFIDIENWDAPMGEDLERQKRAIEAVLDLWRIARDDFVWDAPTLQREDHGEWEQFTFSVFVRR